MKFPDIPTELTDTSLALKKKIPDVYKILLGLIKEALI